jgi:tryptophan-rich sensory protein
MKYFFKQYYVEIIASLLCLALGMLSGGIVTAGGFEWYGQLNKPSFTPPDRLFAPVWSVLYLLMGVALGKIWKESQQKALLLGFIVQLTLNLLWTPLFFYYHRIDLALYDIVLLWFSLIIFMMMVRNKRTLFFLFLPYFVWVSFAVVLNFSLYRLNVF